MKAIILVTSFLLMLLANTYAQVSQPLQDNALALIGEWERIDAKEQDSIIKLIFFPDGKLNLVQSKRPQMWNLRYRLQSETQPLKGEILLTTIGEPDPNSRIPFTIHFDSPSSINLTYTSDEKTKILYLKKVKDIKYGIIPLAN